MERNQNKYISGVIISKENQKIYHYFSAKLAILQNLDFSNAKMCIQCHQHISDEEMVRQLKGDPQFDKWNTTSISHMIIAGLGVNGEEAITLSINMLTKFLDYKDEGGKLDGFILEPCPTSESILNVIKELCYLRCAWTFDQQKIREAVFHTETYRYVWSTLKIEQIGAGHRIAREMAKGCVLV